MKYLFDHLDQVAMWGDILQMAVLDLIRAVRWRSCCMQQRMAVASRRGSVARVHLIKCSPQWRSAPLAGLSCRQQREHTSPSVSVACYGAPHLIPPADSDTVTHR